MKQSFIYIGEMAMEKSLRLDPNNTIMLFDLHGVVFKHNYKKMLATFWHSPQKWQLLLNMFNPFLIWDVIKLAYRRPIPESFFVHLARNYKDIKDALPLLIQIANCQTLQQPVVSLIKKLKKSGYEIALLSNIGERIYIDLEAQHHDLFHLFDHIMVSTPETHYVSKPNPAIYERFMREVNHQHKYIVLIDDKQKNLCGGRPFGIIGIRFTNYNNLIKKLTKLGIDINQSH